jgi:hypothetical protein
VKFGSNDWEQHTRQDKNPRIFKRLYNKSIKNIINLDEFPNNGEEIKIAIVDTAYSANGINRSILVRKSRDFSPTNNQKQNRFGHGTRVLGVLSEICPESKYYLYRIKTAKKVHEEIKNDEKRKNYKKRMRVEQVNKRILECVEQAIADNVDLINLSTGTHHPTCDNCVFKKAIAKAKEANIGVVAAIGNDNDRRGNHVLCPALTEGVLSVGGVVNKCTADINSDELDQRIWADYNPSSFSDTQQGPFCSTEGCAPGYNCENHREKQWWKKNIRSFDSNPQVLAPVHLPQKRNKCSFFTYGTSFATPIVTGVTARIMASDKLRSIGDIIKALKSNGQKLYGPNQNPAVCIDLENLNKSIEKQGKKQ